MEEGFVYIQDLCTFKIATEIARDRTASFGKAKTDMRLVLKGDSGRSCHTLLSYSSSVLSALPLSPSSLYLHEWRHGSTGREDDGKSLAPRDEQYSALRTPSPNLCELTREHISKHACRVGVRRGVRERTHQQAHARRQACTHIHTKPCGASAEGKSRREDAH